MEERRQRRQPGRRPVVIVRRQPRPRTTVRWEVLLVILSILAAAWVVSRIEPAATWNEVMDILHVKHRGFYTQAACLAVLLLAIVAIARVLGYGRGRKE